MELTNKLFWVDHSNDQKYLNLNSDGISEFLKFYSPSAKSAQTSFEFGIYPGNYLKIINSKGYLVNGIDYHPALTSMINERSSEISFGQVLNNDINILKNHYQYYNLVYSIGFIEHFTNWKEVLEMHIDLTEKNGTLVVTCPNFRSLLQRIYHIFWDYHSYKKHYIPSMVPKLWKEILVDRGFDIVYSGYFGGTYFWNEKKNMTKFERFSSDLYVKFVLFIKRILIVKFRPNSAFNCFCGVVAIKR